MAAASSPTSCAREPELTQADAVLVCDMSYYAPGWPAVYTALARALLRGDLRSHPAARPALRHLRRRRAQCARDARAHPGRPQGRRRRDPDPQALQGGEAADASPSSRAGRSCRSTRTNTSSEEVTGKALTGLKDYSVARADLGAADPRDPRHSRRLRGRRRQDGHPGAGDREGEPPAGSRARARQGGEVAAEGGVEACAALGRRRGHHAARRRSGRGRRESSRRSRCSTRRSRNTRAGARCMSGPAARSRSCPELGLAGAPVILTGIGLPDDGLHSPNEKLDLDQLWSGIQIFGRFLELFAEKGGAVAEEERGEPRSSRQRTPSARRPPAAPSWAGPGTVTRCARAVHPRR